MGRHSPNHAYRFKIQRLCDDCYRLFWTVDRYYPKSRLRWPTVTSRDTDEAGAKRFAKKHGVAMPDGA
jgi:hypothetical protein